MSRFRGRFVAFLAGLVMMAGVPASGAETVRDPVIVVLEAGAEPVVEVADRLIAEHGGRRGFVYEHALRGFSAELPRKAIEALARNPQVAYIDPDVPVSLAQTTSQTLPTGVDRVEADLNPGMASYFSDVTVAVIDTGVWFEGSVPHEDLNLSVVFDCTHIYNIFGVCAGTNYADQNGHGTHVAGIIGAKDNGIGSLGVAPGAQIYSFKVINADGTGTLSGVLAGIDAATARASEIEVANMSLTVSPAQQSLDDAIANSIAAGIVYVVAAGNDGADAAGYSPARALDAITVSALADFDGQAGGLGLPTCRNDVVDDQLATWSNFGSVVDIAAPGVCIYSTWLNDGYATISGTSMASPMVAGAVARYIAENGRATDRTGVLAIRDAIVGGAISQGDACGFGGDPDGHPEPLLFLNGPAFGGSGDCTVASSTNGAPEATADAATTDEDTSVVVDVLANDSDPDGDALSVSSVTPPAQGVAEVEPGGVRYTPAPDFHGSDSFSYTITDGLASDTTTVTVTVSPVNDDPVAVDDDAVTSQASPVVVDVLANDSDVDGDALSIASVTQGSNGSAVATASGVTYTPNAGFTGIDTFAYSVSDGHGGVAQAGVQVTVNPANQPPVATDDSAVTDEDSSVVIPVLANDSDPDGDQLSIESVSDPASGSVVVNTDGTVTYTPEGDFYGTDVFDYRVGDGIDGDSAAVTVEVLPVNDPPSAGFNWNCSELACQFGDTSSDVEGALAGWLWEFGDGSTSTSQDPAHTYASDGSYIVRLTVTDGEGLTDTLEATVSVATTVQEVTAQVNPILFDGRTATVDVWVYRTSDLELMPDATVEGDWAFVDRRGRERTKAQSAVTDGLGTATFQTTFPPGSEVLSFCITSVALDGYQYLEVPAVSCYSGYLLAVASREPSID